MRMKTLLHKTTHFREKSAFVIMVTWMGLWYGLFANEGLMFAWWTSLEFSGGTSICCRWNYKKFVVRYKAFCPVFWQDEIQRLCLTIGHIVLQSRTNSPAGRALERPSQNFGRRLRGWIHQRKEKNRNWLPIYGLRGWGDAHCLSLQRSIGSLLDWWIHWCSIEVKALLSLLDSFTNFSSPFQDSATSTLAACWTINYYFITITVSPWGIYQVPKWMSASTESTRNHMVRHDRRSLMDRRGAGYCTFVSQKMILFWHLVPSLIDVLPSEIAQAGSFLNGEVRVRVNRTIENLPVKIILSGKEVARAKVLTKGKTEVKEAEHVFYTQVVSLPGFRRKKKVRPGLYCKSFCWQKTDMVVVTSYSRIWPIPCFPSKAMNFSVKLPRYVGILLL